MLWVGSAVVVAGAVALVVFGGLFGPSDRTVCTATLNQAREFGVLSPSATLASDSAKSTDVKNRKSCEAKVGDDTYAMVVDIKTEDLEHRHCKDYIKQAGCVALYSVARSDGVMTYQVHEIPPEDTDEALAARGLLAAPPAPNAAPAGGAAPAGDAQAAAPAGDSAGGLDADTAVDNSGSMQGGQPQQGAQPQQ